MKKSHNLPQLRVLQSKRILKCWIVKCDFFKTCTLAEIVIGSTCSINTLLSMRISAICFFAIFLLGCSRTETELSEPIDPQRAYDNILKGLDSENPGKGVDIFNNESRHRPMAYGLILSAEANRFRATGDLEAKENALSCLNWLMANPDRNENGIHGYGLADPWDAFTDGSVNPRHHEYTITTAIALEGMLNWLELEDDSANRIEIRNVVEDCLSPFLDDTFYSPIGIPGYSIGEEDLSYNVFNPAVFLAGQMQRYSLVAEDSEMVAELQNSAGQIISLTEEHVQTDPGGDFYWSYGTEISRPNDLVHACYVIEGFRTYIDYGGSVGLDFTKIEEHLSQFYHREKWRENPEEIHSNGPKSARLWALGMAMYTLSESGNTALVESTLFSQIGEYRRTDGTFQFREEDSRKMVRQSAHLLLGLSAFLYGS